MLLTSALNMLKLDICYDDKLERYAAAHWFRP